MTLNWACFNVIVIFKDDFQIHSKIEVIGIRISVLRIFENYKIL